MASQVQGVTQHQIADRATLNTDLLLLDYLLEVRMLGYLETVTNSLCPQNYGVYKVLTESLGSFSCMENDREFGTRFLPCIQNELREVLDRR